LSRAHIRGVVKKRGTKGAKKIKHSGKEVKLLQGGKSDRKGAMEAYQVHKSVKLGKKIRKRWRIPRVPERGAGTNPKKPPADKIARALRSSDWARKRKEQNAETKQRKGE